MNFALSPSQRWFAQTVGRLLILAGIVSFAASFVAPWLSGATFACSSSGCSGYREVLAAAPDAAKAVLSASPSALAQFESYLALPIVRGSLLALAAIAALPLALLLGTAGGALFCLGARKQHALAIAAPWLRRASFAAIAMVVVTPLTDSLRVMLLLQGTPIGPMWWVEADLIKTGLQLILAFTAVAISWAIDVGSRAELEVDKFV